MTVDQVLTKLKRGEYKSIREFCEYYVTEDKATDIVNDYVAGMRMKMLRWKYNVTDKTVYNILARCGVNHRRIK